MENYEDKFLAPAFHALHFQQCIPGIFASTSCRISWLTFVKQQPGLYKYIGRARGANMARSCPTNRTHLLTLMHQAADTTRRRFHLVVSFLLLTKHLKRRKRQQQQQQNQHHRLFRRLRRVQPHLRQMRHLRTPRRSLCNNMSPI